MNQSHTRKKKAFALFTAVKSRDVSNRELHLSDQVALDFAGTGRLEGKTFHSQKIHPHIL